jgi:hypothetical protein
MEKTFEGYLFNRIEKIGDKKYNHVGCEGEDKSFGDFLSEFVPETGMRRRVRFRIKSLEKPKMIKSKTIK